MKALQVVTADLPGPSACRFKVPTKGRRAIWQITNLCNYSCGYCIFASGPEKISGELPTDRALAVVEELAKLGFEELKITGGEPLVRRDIIDILRAIDGKGISFDLSTNASRINKELARELSKLNLKYIHVSLDGGSKEVQERIRGAKSFDSTHRGLRLLQEAGVPVRIGSVICKDNQESLDQIVDCAVNVGAREIIFSRMIAAGRLRGNREAESDLDNHSLIKSIKQLQERYLGKIVVSNNIEGAEYICSRCPGGDSFIYIDNLGHVLPCTWAVESGLVSLSSRTLSHYSLDLLLKGEEIQRFRFQLHSEDIIGCPISGQEG